MIPPKSALRHRAVWQKELAEAIVDPAELLEILGLDTAMAAARAMGESFPLRVPRAFVARMKKHDPTDPLLRQVLPSDEESRTVSGFCGDPLAEQRTMTVPGVLHKYHGRVLLIATGACVKSPR